MRILLSVSAALLTLACTRTAAVLILDARVSRAPDNRVVADVELEAVDQGGGHAGPYCVSIHWFNVGFNPSTEERISYADERDSVEECHDDLEDGDQRTVRLISNKSDLEAGLPARVQVRYAETFQIRQGVFAP
jgi:hypothetical protein